MAELGVAGQQHDLPGPRGQYAEESSYTFAESNEASVPSADSAFMTSSRSTKNWSPKQGRWRTLCTIHQLIEIMQSAKATTERPEESSGSDGILIRRLLAERNPSGRAHIRIATAKVAGSGNLYLTE
jgi:hypothetical protein